jgi:hypothetical protein
MNARFLAAAALAALLGVTVAAAQAPPPAGQTLGTVRQRG